MTMGRTSILAAEGSNAIFSNPAILATLQNMQVQGGGRVFFGGVVASDDETIESATLPRHVKLDHLSFAMPYPLADSSLHLAFGIGYHSYYDFGYKVGDDEADVLSTSTGGLNTISPAVAISYQDKYFAGLSLHKSIRSDIVEEFEGADVEDETETSASFFMLGVLARLTSDITVGGMYRSGFDWDWELDNGGDVEWENPALWGIGASFRLSSRWILIGEYRSLPFSAYERNGRDEAFGVDDGYSARMGFEKGGRIPFRFGFFRDAIPERDFDKDDPKFLTGAAIGFGFPITGVRINLGWEAAYWQQDLSDEVQLAELLARFRFSAQYQFN